MEALPTGSGSTDIFLTRWSLYDVMKQSNVKNIEDQISSLKIYIQNRTNCPKNLVSNIKKKLSYFVADFKKKWQESNRKEDRFLQKNRIWLETSISFPKYTSKNKKKGRPEKTFENVSERSKRQKTEKLRAQHSYGQLSYAAQMSLRSSGQIDASKVIKDVTMTSPKRASKYRTAYNKLKIPQTRKLGGTEALSMFIDASLTREEYNKIRRRDLSRLPAYKKIQLAKTECYPEKEVIIVTETSAEVKVQGLLDHTVSRILKSQEDVLKNQRLEKLRKLCLITKWGFDGSNQSEYKQRFTTNPEATDANIFIASLVPLRLTTEKSGRNEQVIIWQNKRCSSTRFCRPIRFQFAHETAELSKSKKIYIDNQIKQLQPTNCFIGDTCFEISHKMLFTMVDGKVCNALTETLSTQRCYICSLTCKDFNDISKVLNAQSNKKRLQFGLSVLHAWIRFLECILHLSYKLTLKTWQARGKENKEIVAKNKKRIQTRFKKEMGLVIDKPKQGFGNSNDGNTARRFFHDPEKSAAITGVSVEVIKRFKVILQTIASGHLIDNDKFRKYALDTAKVFVEKYPWYPMPPTVHKILIHGPDVIAGALLPIGQLSEEAQEASNKIFKKYRENFARKMCREKTNEDVLNRLLIASDPYISSLQEVHTTKKAFDKEVLEMLLPPTVKESSGNEVADCSSDSSENEIDDLSSDSH